MSKKISDTVYLGEFLVPDIQSIPSHYQIQLSDKKYVEKGLKNASPRPPQNISSKEGGMKGTIYIKEHQIGIYTSLTEYLRLLNVPICLYKR